MGGSYGHLFLLMMQIHGMEQSHDQMYDGDDPLKTILVYDGKMSYTGKLIFTYIKWTTWMISTVNHLQRTIDHKLDISGCQEMPKT